MADVTYLPEVRCTIQKGGLYPNGITVGLLDAQGIKQYIQLADGMVYDREGTDYLPVEVAQIDRGRRRVLVELPMATDSGYHRIWIGFDAFRKSVPDQAEVAQ